MSSRSVLETDASDVPETVLKRCCTCGQAKQWHQFNRNRSLPDGLSAQCRDCQRAQHRKHYERHKAKVLAKTDTWRQKNPDKPYEYGNRHRAHLVGAVGEFTAEEWTQLKRKYKFRCLRCGAFEGSLWAPRLSPDHVVPLSRGGRNTIDNIQPLCPRCNRWKRSKSIDFRQRRFEMDKVWMKPPFGAGEPKEVDAMPEVLVPLMTAGWSQCDPPVKNEEVTTNVHD